MGRKTAPVRYIKPTSIRIGDTLRVEEDFEDATVIKIGMVAKRDIGPHATEYLTAKGIVLVTHWREHDKYGKIYRLSQATNVTELEDTLF